MKPIIFLLLLLGIGCTTSTSNKDYYFFDFSKQKEFVYDVEMITTSTITGFANEEIAPEVSSFKTQWVIFKKNGKFNILQKENEVDGIPKKVILSGVYPRNTKKKANPLLTLLFPKLPKGEKSISIPILFTIISPNQKVVVEGSSEVNLLKQTSETLLKYKGNFKANAEQTADNMIGEGTYIFNKNTGSFTNIRVGMSEIITMKYEGGDSQNKQETEYKLTLVR